MKAIAALGVVGLLLLQAFTVNAEPGVGVDTTASPQPLELRPPPQEKTRPKARAEHALAPHAVSTPAFLGLTMRGETTEFGVSGWIAPNPPVGSPRTAGGDVNGWGVLGLTFTEGGTSPRGATGSAIR
jgi:hypothetical protein